MVGGLDLVARNLSPKIDSLSGCLDTLNQAQKINLSHSLHFLKGGYIGDCYRGY